jgi:hypothetical protein
LKATTPKDQLESIILTSMINELPKPENLEHIRTHKIIAQSMEYVKFSRRTANFGAAKIFRYPIDKCLRMPHSQSGRYKLEDTI